jgi:hypothetical protein
MACAGASVHSRWRFTLSLAFFGFLANAALLAYMELSDYTPLAGRWAPLVLVACPSNLIASYLFFDVNAHAPLMAFAWVFQAMLNTAIYFVVGVIAGRLFWKSP